MIVHSGKLSRPNTVVSFLCVSVDSDRFLGFPGIFQIMALEAVCLKLKKKKKSGNMSLRVMWRSYKSSGAREPAVSAASPLSAR